VPQCFGHVQNLTNSSQVHNLPTEKVIGQLVDRQLEDCQLADWTSRKLVNSWSRQLVDCTSRGLDNLRSRGCRRQ